ncbi:hypothetical protein BBP40_010002 [Aspergillus hancockii]|nr:hypothetical protein BBP40_010002 [Aspergillus hancockii]
MELGVEQPNKFCPLCGVILMWEEFEDLPESRRPWYAEVRVAAKEEHQDCFMTGVGIMDNTSCVFAPVDEELDYMNATDMEEVELFRTESELHGFGFHDSCWMLLQDRLWHTIDSDEIARSLYDQFYCTPCPELISLQLGHDYGGAMQWHHRMMYGPPTLDCLPLHFQSDPYMVPLLEKIEENAPDVADTKKGVPAPPTLFGDVDSGYRVSLGKLSLEILHEVISYLSIEELLSLRRTSRELAQRLMFRSLPQSFWKRQFTRGHRMDFLFPDLEQKRDWFRLYRGTMAYLKGDSPSSESYSILNRRRIRRLLEPIASLVEVDIKRSKEPRGRRANCQEFRIGHWILSEGLKTLRVENIYRADISHELEYLPHGCGTPRYRIGTFPSQMTNGGQIKVTTVQLGARNFIAGISYYPHNTETTAQHAVGYEQLTGQSTIEVTSDAITEKLEVAFSPEGLRGIRLHFSDGIVSEWVGDTEDENMSYGILQIPNSQTFNILAGSDAYKLTAIGIAFDEPEDEKPSDGMIAQPTRADFTLPISYLWKPQQPNYRSLRVYQFQPDIEAVPYRPWTNIDFGGPDGVWLSSLTSMEVHVSSEWSPINKIIFHYTDRALQFGTGAPGDTLTFNIDGPGGERITQIEAYTVGFREASVICTLKITTNYGREMMFGPPDVITNQRGDYNEPPELPRGSLITGLVGSNRWDEDYFSIMGVQVQLYDVQAATSIHCPSKSITSPAKDLQHIP